MGNGGKVAEQQRTHRKHHEHLLPVNGQGQHALHQQADHDGKSGQLGRASNHQGDPGGRTLVDIRDPHVKWHDAKLESQARDHKHQAKHQHLVVHMARVDGAKHGIDIQRAGGAIHHGQAVQQKS